MNKRTDGFSFSNEMVGLKKYLVLLWCLGTGSESLGMNLCDGLRVLLGLEGHPEHYYERGLRELSRPDVLKRPKRQRAAVKNLGRALALDADHGEARRVRGMVQFLLGKDSLAEEDLRRVIEDNPEDIQAHLVLAAALLRRGDSKGQILGPLGIFMEGTPKAARGFGHYLQGMVHLFSGDHKRALADLSQALQVGLGRKEEGPLYFWKGVSHTALEQEEKAVEAFHSSLERGLSLPPMEGAIVQDDSLRIDASHIMRKALEEREESYKHFQKAAINMGQGNSLASLEDFDTALSTALSWEERGYQHHRSRSLFYSLRAFLKEKGRLHWRPSNRVEDVL